MLKPYSVIEITREVVTYEFKTIYLWGLYGILVIGGFSIFFEENVLAMIAGGCMLTYFFAVSLPYRKLAAITKHAALTGTVKYSGSKWSFSNPLRITIPTPNT